MKVVKNYVFARVIRNCSTHIQKMLMPKLYLLGTSWIRALTNSGLLSNPCAHTPRRTSKDYLNRIRGTMGSPTTSYMLGKIHYSLKRLCRRRTECSPCVPSLRIWFTWSDIYSISSGIISKQVRISLRVTISRHVPDTHTRMER